MLRGSYASVAVMLHRSFSDLLNFYKQTTRPIKAQETGHQFIPQRSENVWQRSTRKGEGQRCQFHDLIRNLTNVIVAWCKRGEVPKAE